MPKKRMKLSFTIAGTVIGAGFATGKELLLFFDNTPFSLLCLFCSVLLMGIVSVLYFAENKHTETSRKQSRITQQLFLLFSGASYAVMLSCGGEALFQSVNLPCHWGTILTCAVTLLIVSFGVENVYRFNLIATPVLLVCMAGIALAGLVSPVGLLGSSRFKSVNLLLYSGYNLLSVLPLLGALREHTEQRELSRGIVWGFSMVAVVGLLLKGFLLRHTFLTEQTAIPVLSIISYLDSHLEILYIVMLYCSILTTAVNSLYAVSKGKNTIFTGLFLLCCGFFGFSDLIETLYPLFGYLGIGVMVTVIVKTLCKSK